MKTIILNKIVYLIKFIVMLISLSLNPALNLVA